MPLSGTAHISYHILGETGKCFEPLISAGFLSSVLMVRPGVREGLADASSRRSVRRDMLGK